MKISALLALLPLASAASIPARSTNANSKFSIMSARSGSPVHLLPMNAVHGSFWLGESPSTYCPENIEELGACPPGTSTRFASETALDVVVPGGQRIYIDPRGALRFTQAHSAYIPPGSSMGPFTYTPGPHFGQFSYTGQGASGFLACPRSNGTATHWQVYGSAANVTASQGCLGFDALAVPTNSTGAAAWEYI
ncbi:putative IgE-binding protein [Aspergillus clavatus NRRL 1]|uniref:IgE-binding protein, putative n=1 Tax=Aspergillus clavatus (strain ATCC 1007 / CBS 513.65 / DSM 816 / NCTC 3887 / NRRL 1 / QM 1276 / 107) TaxID=344612 RepID=A1CMH7_ASPCL|nr:IgE-binding protein, putative [Aspergillus clavatus NRRL 1]EAW08764.1 IgE-binding protein, putative [Aspergillus clavatus NRRL 1]